MTEMGGLSTVRTANAYSEPADAFDHRGELAEGWDELGQLQLDYLIGAGLLPDHAVLDIGCGALRAGKKIIGYLDKAKYFGIDPDKRLLNFGHLEELRSSKLRGKCPRAHLYCSHVFKHERLAANTIDFGLCVSVVRDLTFNYLRVCLENTAPYFRSGATLHCSFFELGAYKPLGQPYTNMARYKSFGLKRPYHYFRRDLEHAAQATAWSCEYFGSWDHPEGETMMIFKKR